MKTKLSLILTVFALVLGFSMFVGNNAALAGNPLTCDPGESTGNDDGGECNGDCDRGDHIQSGDCDGKCDAGENACSVDCDPLGQCAFGDETVLTSTDVRTVASRIINIILTLLGTVATVIILIGGFKWMTGGGNEDKVGEAKKLMAAGVVGLAIVLTAYSIATFVINNLESATVE